MGSARLPKFDLHVGTYLTKKGAGPRKYSILVSASTANDLSMSDPATVEALATALTGVIRDVYAEDRPDGDMATR